MSSVRILVTGSRSWGDTKALRIELRDLYWQLRNEGAASVVIVHGDCPTGADRACREWVEQGKRAGLSVEHEPHPANWDAQGSAAGPIRNQRMVDLGAVLCLAFPKGESRGTWDCIKRANRAGIPVRIVPERKR